MNHWFLATTLCYAASLAGYVAFPGATSQQRGLGRAASLLLAAGIVFHYLALVERSRGAHTVPYNDLYGSLSLFAWLLALTYFGLELFHRQRSVGAFVLPVVLLVFLVSSGRSAAPAATPPASGPLLALHITHSVVWGYAAFALSFVLSLIYLIQNQLLRHHRLQNVIWRFPALEVLERVKAAAAWRSVCFCTACRDCLRAPFGWHRIFGRYWNGDPKEVITFVILAAYAGYLWLGRTAAWRGARASAVCVFNFGCSSCSATAS